MADQKDQDGVDPRGVIQGSGDLKTVLVYFQEHRRPVTFRSGTGDAKALLDAAGQVFADVLEDDTTLSRVLLQVKSEEWDGEFVDVGDCSIEDKSKVRAVLTETCRAGKSEGSSVPVSTSDKVEDKVAKGKSLCATVSKPSTLHRKVLSKLFPSSMETSRPTSTTAFDPTDPVVVLRQKSKKKSTSNRSKPFKRWVLVLKDTPSRVPTSTLRRKLMREGRQSRLEFRRNMSKQEVKNTFIRNFPKLKLTEAKFWKCSTKDGSIYEVPVTGGFPNGDELVEIAGRETVYITENTEVIDVDSMTETKTRETSTADEDDVSPADAKRRRLLQEADRVLYELRRKPPPPHVSSPESSESSEDDEPLLSPVPEETLQQRRDLIQQQDEAYEESLRIDRARAQQAQGQQETSLTDQSLANLRAELLQKSGDGPSRGLTVAVRLPTGSKIHHTFGLSSTTQDLYQFVFAHGNINEPFKIFCCAPRREVLCNSSLLEDCGVSNSVLIAEADDRGTNPRTWISEHYLDNSCAQDSVKELEMEKAERDRFLSTLACTPGARHEVQRDKLFEDVVHLYQSTQFLHESPIRIKFAGERAIDTGGVCRDMFAGFWEDAYARFFDGSSLLTPVLHPHVDMALLPMLGVVLSHGYLHCGILPARVAFPSLAAIVKGPSVQVPDHIFCQCLTDYVTSVEREFLKKALQVQHFDNVLQQNVVAILARFGCREIPTPPKIRTLLVQIAKYEFLTRPMAALVAISGGIPTEHVQFWEKKSVTDLYAMYVMKFADPQKTLTMIEEPLFLNANEERVFGYLLQMVGNAKSEEVQQFVRFVTGSPVLTTQRIQVRFNGLDGISRRPIAHTCSCLLELPHTYVSYREFHTDFTSVLANEYSWIMDCI